MRKLILATFLLLISAIGIKAQSTDVSATVTDNAGQIWAGGTYTFTSLSPQQPPFTGNLDGTASFVVTLPHNQFTQAVNEVWTFSVCPDVSIPAVGNGCFTTNVTVAGPTQNITSQIHAVAPSLVIPIFPAAISTIRAYNDAEISSTPKGGVYYNVTLQQERICTAIAGTPTLPTCTTWVANGGGGGPGGTVTLNQILDPNINKTFNLGTTTLSFTNGTVNFQNLSFALTLPVIPGCTTNANGQVCYDSTANNWHFFQSADSIVPTLLTSGTYTTNDVLGISNVGGKLTLIDLGPVNGTSGSSFLQITTTNLLTGDAVCWDGTKWINCTPGVPPVIITGTTYTVNCGTDRGAYLIFTAATPIAVTLPQASTSGTCDANFFVFMRTINAQLTVTPTISTVDDGGGAGATLVISPGYGTSIFSDNTNYFARVNPFRESGNPLMSVEGFDVNTLGGYDWQSPNNASPGTSLNKMACDDGTGKLQTCAFATAATNNPVGVAVTGIGAAPGTTGNTAICFIGFCKVFFDNAATANHFAQLSTSVNGDLSDTGSTSPPTNGQPYWYIFASNSGSNTTGIVRDLSPSELSAVSINGGGKSTIQLNGANLQPVVNIANTGCTQFTAANSGNTSTVSTHVCHELTFDIGAPGGTALTGGANDVAYLSDIPWACTLKRYSVGVDAGTATVKWWKIAAGTALPTVANVINTSGVGVASGTVIQSATISDFTTSTFAAHDIFAMKLTAVATAAWVQGTLTCQE